MMQKAWLTLGSEAGTLYMSNATKSKETRNKSLAQENTKILA